MESSLLSQQRRKPYNLLYATQFRVQDRSFQNMSLRRRSSQSFLEHTENYQHPKRRRIDTGSLGESSQRPDLHSNDPDIESIDLTEVKDAPTLSKALSKQREEAVKSQHTSSDEAGRSALTSYRCPVCMDVANDATTTMCGHLFCHKCIIDTIRFSEDRRNADSHGKASRGNCPVCRKPLNRTDTGTRRNLIPIQLKLATKKRT